MVTEATELSVTPVLQRLLDEWYGDLDAPEQRHLEPLLEQLSHVPTHTAREPQQSTLGWRCTDHLVRVHVPHWIEATGLSEFATPLRALAELGVVEGADSAISLLEKASLALADQKRASRDVVQKETWSRAWPSAWNIESSSRWAYARDASIGATTASGWQTAFEAMKRTGFLTLVDADDAERDRGRDALGGLALELTSGLIAEVAWVAAWQPTWAIAAAGSYVPRAELDRTAAEATREAVNPLAKTLFEETLVFIGELLRGVV